MSQLIQRNLLIPASLHGFEANQNVGAGLVCLALHITDPIDILNVRLAIELNVPVENVCREPEALRRFVFAQASASQASLGLFEAVHNRGAVWCGGEELELLWRDCGGTLPLALSWVAQVHGHPETYVIKAIATAMPNHAQIECQPINLEDFEQSLRN